MKALCAGLIVAGLIVAAAGCSGHGPYQARTYGPGRTSLEHTEKVVYVDSSLQKKVVLVDQSMTVTEDGRLGVFCELENRTRRNLVVQVQTQFRDAAGQLMTDQTNWRTIVMAPNSSTSYQTISLNDRAKDYIIRVKLEARH